MCKFLWISASWWCCPIQIFFLTVVSSRFYKWNLLFDLFHSFITHCGHFFSTVWSGLIYRPSNFLFIFLDVPSCWLIKIELVAKSSRMRAWRRLSNSNIFSIRHISKSLTKRTKMKVKVTLNRLWNPNCHGSLCEYFHYSPEDLRQDEWLKFK